MQNTMTDFHSQCLKFFDSPWPRPEDLINFANAQQELEQNIKEFERIQLGYLIASFVEFLKPLDQTQSNQSFWITKEPQDGKFPFQELQKTLNRFWKTRSLWIVDNLTDYNQEHFVVLIYIAALRYVKFPPPLMQKKIAKKESKGQSQLADIFLFNQSNYKSPDYPNIFALQLNLLTSPDITLQEELSVESDRSKQYIENGLSTVKDLFRYNYCLGQANAYANNRNIDPEIPKALYMLVHVRPDDILWNGCGLYDETVAPGMLNPYYPSKRNNMITMFDSHWERPQESKISTQKKKPINPKKNQRDQQNKESYKPIPQNHRMIDSNSVISTQASFSAEERTENSLRMQSGGPNVQKIPASEQKIVSHSDKENVLGRSLAQDDIEGKRPISSSSQNNSSSEGLHPRHNV